MNIIIFGPPGAGKGTQAENILKDFKLLQVSSGKLLRQEVLNQSSLGQEISEILKKGSFVSDNIINQLIEKIVLNKNFSNKIIFDGYPRNLEQANKLDFLLSKCDQKISAVLSLEVDKETIIKRILGRISCSNCGVTYNKFFYPPTSINHKCDKKYLSRRSDDNQTTVETRYDTYLKKTLPLLEYYEKGKLLHKIDGKAEIADIYAQIKAILSSL